jgi:DNA-binding winged helix-turn-helix (wHTH) protein
MTDLPFGPFTLEPAASRLLRDGVEVRLRPQAFQALKVRLDHRGRSVGYEQMIAEAWKGTFVSRHTVDVTVGEVRKTLGEYASWITHRPKVGYCLEVPTSDALVRKGWHFWDRRTRQGFDSSPRSSAFSRRSRSAHPISGAGPTDIRYSLARVVVRPRACCFSR